MTGPSQEGVLRSPCKRPNGHTGKSLRAKLAALRGPYCGICTLWIDMLLEGTLDPGAPTLDHIIALADGGTNAFENFQLAHRSCNEIKASDKAKAEEQAARDRKRERWERHMVLQDTEQARAKRRRTMRRTIAEMNEALIAARRIDNPPGELRGYSHGS